MNHPTSGRRRIAVASFTIRDVSQLHMSLGVAGLVTCLAGVATIYLSSVAVSARADAVAVARIMATQATTIAQTVKTGSKGSVEALAGLGAGVAGGLRSLSRTATAFGAPPDIARAGASANAAWNEFNTSIAGYLQGSADAQAIVDQATAVGQRADMLQRVSPWVAKDEVWLMSFTATLGGVLMLVGAIVLALRDVEGRYARALGQFRGGERARDELIRELASMETPLLVDRVHVSADGSTDIGQITDALNKVLGRLASQVADVGQGLRSAGAGVRASSAVRVRLKEIASVIRSVAESHRSTLLEGGRVASSAGGLARALSVNAADARGRVSEVTLIAQEGEARLDATRDEVAEAARRVKHLGEVNQEIALVVDSLELIAGQSAVLSLNASLEAERAGEQGVGFRLLAQEISALAHRVDDVTHKISDLVAGAQADARAAGESMERSAAQLAQGGNFAVLAQALVSVVGPLAEDLRSGSEGLQSDVASSAASMSAAREGLDQILESLSGVAVCISELDELTDRAGVAVGAASAHIGVSPAP